MEKRSLDQKKTDQVARRQLRFGLMLPVLVIPFLTGAFWALGGGKGDAGKGKQAAAQHGFNTNLPQPHFDKKTILDKLGFYQKADMDSSKLAQKEKTDPYLATKSLVPDQKQGSLFDPLPPKKDAKGSALQGAAENGALDANEQKVFKKLDQLKQIINQPSMGNLPGGQGGFPAGDMRYSDPSLPHSSPDMARLEEMMRRLKEKPDSGTGDPDMDKLNGMLDKLMKIQHPEMVTAPEKAAPQGRPSEKPKPAASLSDPGAFMVPGPSRGAGSDTNGLPQSVPSDGFLSFDDNDGPPADPDNTIRAVISEDQTLVSGATVKLRLTEPVNLDGVALAGNSYVYGTASLSGERLLISVKSVLSGTSILPVNWQVYDLDGMAGIFIPGAIGRDVSKESAAEGVNSLGITGLDASLGAQAATAGIQAAKTLFSKKVKLVRVSLRAGYEVLLKKTKVAE